MKPNLAFTLKLREGGDKGGNVWESGKEEKARFPNGTVPRSRH